MSSWLFEKLLLGKFLGYPYDVLFGQSNAWKWIRKLMLDYFEPLPIETQKAVLDKGEKVGVPSFGKALFWAAYSNAREMPVVMNRLGNFLNLYGFCRNVALVAFIDAAVLYWSYLQPMGPHEHLVWARIALVVGLGMIMRYLKFFRQYAIEVFTSYAYAKEQEKKV